MKNLEVAQTRASKSKGRQFVHTLKSGNKDERDLESLLKKLDRASLDLAGTILVVNVGVSRSLRWIRGSDAARSSDESKCGKSAS